MAFRQKGGSKYFKRRYKKQGFKRVNRRINKKAIVRNTPLRGVNMGAGFPAKLTVTHKYFDRPTMTSTNGILTINNFTANGMNDPNISGLGHQPLYFDNIGLIYDHYTVIMSRIKVTFTNTSTVPVYGMVILNDDTSLANSTFYGQMEQTGSKYVVLGTKDSGNDTKTVTKYFGLTKTYGKGKLNDDLYRGSPSTNPSEQMYYSVICQSIDESTTSVVYASVEIEYVAVWSELNDLAQS